MENTKNVEAVKKEEPKKTNRSEALSNEGYRSLDIFHPFFSLFDDSGDEELMRTDIGEDDKGYTLKVEVPGVKKENVKVTFEDGYLKVGYTISSKDEEKSHGKLIREERRCGYYSREYFVGYNYDKKDFKASLKDGLLTVYIPKKEAEKDGDSAIAID